MKAKTSYFLFNAVSRAVLAITLSVPNAGLGQQMIEQNYLTSFEEQFAADGSRMLADIFSPTSDNKGFIWNKNREKRFFDFNPSKMSDDGWVVTGTKYTPINSDEYYRQAVYHDPISGTTVLTPNDESYAFDVSDDGLVVCGSFYNPSGDFDRVSESFVWNPVFGLTRLGQLSGYVDNEPRFFSGDGSTVFGVATRANATTRAFIWKPASGSIQWLGNVRPAGISYNGTWVAYVKPDGQGFLWSEATGETALGVPPHGARFMYFDHLSDDGNYAHGLLQTNWTSFPCIWGRTFGFHTGPGSSPARAISENGAHYVFREFSSPGNARFQLYSSTTGTSQNINQLLINNGVDLGGVIFDDAMFVSDDGKVIYAKGSRNFSNGSELRYFRIDLGPARRSVTIDAVPNSSTNRFRLSSSGNLQVIVFSSASVDARTIPVNKARIFDPVTVADLGTPVAAVSRVVRDYNGDGRQDVNFRYRIPDIRIAGSFFTDSTQFFLEAETSNGIEIRGITNVTVLP